MTVPVRTQTDDPRKSEVGSGDRPTSMATDRRALIEAVTGPWARRASATSMATDRRALIEGLNHDLAGEYQAILMYTHYSAKLTGPYRRELRALFQAEIADEQGHAQFLADKIAALGGEPTTVPRPVPYADQPRQMLEYAWAAEGQAVADYNARVYQAGGFGDFGLKANLENQVADETRHKEELERIIAGWDER